MSLCSQCWFGVRSLRFVWMNIPNHITENFQVTEEIEKDMSITENNIFAPPQESYLQLFLRFLRFGLLAWGGPVAQIAMIRQELVDEERWISSERFNRILAVYQVLPGPEAHELCVHFGMIARGRIGAILA